MINFIDEYRKKSVQSQKAVQTIDSNSTVVLGMASGTPPALCQALADQIRSGSLKNLNVYYKIATKHLENTLLSSDVLPHISAKTLFMSKIDRDINKRQIEAGSNTIDFIPCHFSMIPHLMRELPSIDTVLVTVSSMDKFGYFSLGTNNDYISTAVQCAKKLIVEVNKNMPRVFGQSQIHISQVDYIVENDCPLVEFKSCEPTDTDLQIGQLVAPLVPNGATIQLGIGKVPGGVARALVDHKNLGIHSELLVNEMIPLIESGVINGRCKTRHYGKHVFTLALCDQTTFDFMNDNPSIASYSSEYVNGIETIAAHDNMISINSAIEIDLYGQVNAEFINGQEFSGCGGQYDFVKGSAQSKGGKSIIALHSTAIKGTRSTIVPKVSMVTDVRMDVEYVVTEHGVVNLRGKSNKERALALISIAHPHFRDELIKTAQGLILI